MVVFLVERAMQRQENVAGSGTAWVLLLVLACHWIEVFKALMATVVVSPWCRVLRAARQDLRATLIPFMFFFIILVGCI